MNFVKSKKKRNFHFQIMKNLFGSGLFSMGLSDKVKQKYFIFGPTMFAIPFHEYSISQNFLGVSCCQIILYTYYHVHGL